MKCSCCGKKRGLFESFEHISDDVDVCVKCAVILYKLREAINEEKEDDISSVKAELKKRGNKKMSQSFKLWLKDTYSI